MGSSVRLTPMASPFAYIYGSYWTMRHRPDSILCILSSKSRFDDGSSWTTVACFCDKGGFLEESVEAVSFNQDLEAAHEEVFGQVSNILDSVGTTEDK